MPMLPVPLLGGKHTPGAGKCRPMCLIIISVFMFGTPMMVDVWHQYHNLLVPTNWPSLPVTLNAANITEVGSLSKLSDEESGTSPRCLPSLHSKVLGGGEQCSMDSNYCYDDSGQVHWVPINHCILPPPQTFWMIGSGSTIKGVGLGVAFWTKLHGKENTLKDKAVVAFVATQSLVSAALLIYKAWSMSGFDSWFRHSQCWGIILADGPWVQNMVLYLGKFRTIFSMINDAPVEDKYDSLEIKITAHYFIGISTFCALVIANGVFTATNLIPAAVCFCWVFLALFCCALALFCCAMGFRQCLKLFGDHLSWIECKCCTCCTDEEQQYEFSFNIVPLLFIPIAVVLDIYMQWFASTSVYWYQGVSYWCSAWISTSERRSDIYMQNFERQVLGQSVWAGSLINQLLP